jgi:large subunit ribosomal protein L21
VKFRRRKHYMRMKGHRQNYTQVRINEISAA